jgi:hypothetical protein
MTITFENDKDVIVYALEKIISYARNHRYIFLAQSIWWISSIIGLQEELISHIDNLKERLDVLIQRVSSVELNQSAIEESSPNLQIHPDRVRRIQASQDSYTESDIESNTTTETDIHNEVINNCEAFLEQSKQKRKAIGRFTREASKAIKRKADRIAKRRAKRPIKTFGTQTEGIDGSELRRRKAAGECQRCAWPLDRKGGHKTIDCFRWKKLERRTAPFQKKKKYIKD